MLKADIEKDLKSAMLSGDKKLVEILRSIKSAILYKEVADGNRQEGLSEESIIAVLKKEKKSRKESVDVYKKANETERAELEMFQIKAIDKYLPAEMTESETEDAVNSAIKHLSIDQVSMSDMGRIIGEVKKQTPSADGAVISKILKARMSQ